MSSSSPKAPAEKAPPTRIFLVRHGTAENSEGAAVGQIDLPLAARGAEDLRRLAPSWTGPPPDRLVTSGLARSIGTAEVLREELGWDLAITQDARLNEMDFGEWDGRTWADLRAEDGERLKAWMERWWEAPAPGGEGFLEVAARACAWLEEILAAAPGETVVAVGHGGSIRTLLGHLLGMPLEKAFHLRLEHSRVSGIETTFRGAEVAFVNSPHFPSLDR